MFNNLFNFVLYYKYILIFFLAIIEGPIIMSFSGFMWRLDYFNFFPVYFVLVFGDLTADAIWYGIGYFAGNKFIEKYGKYFNISEDKLLKFREIFNKHQFKILFFSKITMGFGFALAVLVSAGISKIPFKKYISINFFGQIIWTFLLLVFGYFFGSVYLIIDKSLKILFIVFSIIFFIFFIHGLNNYFKNRSKI